jgi:hypothetical protein
MEKEPCPKLTRFLITPIYFSKKYIKEKWNGWVSFPFQHHDPTQFMILQLQNIEKCACMSSWNLGFLFLFFIHPPTHGREGGQLEGSICSKDCFLFKQAFLKGDWDMPNIYPLTPLHASHICFCFTHMPLL